MLTFRNLALRRGEQLLLSNVDLSLHAGCRVGVVGRNGCGKTSLFSVVQGDLDPDRGDMDLSGRVRIASVAQETPSLPDPAVDFVMSGTRWCGGYPGRARSDGSGGLRSGCRCPPAPR